MFRLILVSLFLGLYAFYGLFANVVIWLIRFKNKKRADLLAYRYLQGAARGILFFSGVTAEVKGMENLTPGTKVYVLNHRSIFDIVLSFRYLPEPTGFIAKKELEHTPWLAHWMRLNHCLFLDRNDIREGVKVIGAGVSYLKEGVSMAVFPEGTRNHNTEDRFALLDFHAGSFKLATRTDFPILPVTMYNTSAIFEDHSPYLKKTKVKITFGEPIPVKDLSTEEKRFLSETVRRKMEEMIEEYK